MHLSSASPRGGGGPRADVGEYGDFMGTLQQISDLVVGEMWGLGFLNALLSGRMWDFASVQLRGDWERTIVRSINGWINRFKTAFREFRTIKKVDIFNFALCLEAENELDDIL